MANEKSDKFTPKELGLTKKEASNLIKLLENKAPENAKKLKKSLGMKDGGLAMAIEKVKAKEMKFGGVAKPKSKPKNFKKTVQKQKRDRAIADGDMVIGDFNEMTPSMMQDFYKNASKVKEMELGGEAVPSKFKGFSKLPEGVQEKINPKLASTYEKGGKVEKYGGGGKVKGGKMSCRGMGAALKGGGYTIS